MRALGCSLVLGAALASACHSSPPPASNEGGGGTSVTTSSTGGAGSTTTSSTSAFAACNLGTLGGCNPFGVDLTAPDLSGEAYWDFIKQTLKVPHYRPGTITLDGSGACDRCTEAVEHALRLVLVVRAGAPGSPSGPPADESMYRHRLGALLDAHAAAVAAVVIEEEPDVPARWSGTTAQYLALLAAGCEVARERGVPCGNGGVSSTSMIFLLADHYAASGHAAAAAQMLALAEDNPEVKAAFTPWPPQTAEDIAAGLASVKARVDAAKALFAGVSAAGVDLVNMHWRERDQDSLDTAMALSRSLSGCYALMTTNLGQRTQDAVETLRKAGDADELGMRIVIWSSREESGEALLTDGQGGLSPNGTALQDLSLKASCLD